MDDLADVRRARKICFIAVYHFGVYRHFGVTQTVSTQRLGRRIKSARQHKRSSPNDCRESYESTSAKCWLVVKNLCRRETLMSISTTQRYFRPASAFIPVVYFDTNRQFR